jgi:hypothetical protein
LAKGSGFAAVTLLGAAPRADSGRRIPIDLVNDNWLELLWLTPLFRFSTQLVCTEHIDAAILVCADRGTVPVRALSRACRLV